MRLPMVCVNRQLPVRTIGSALVLFVCSCTPSGGWTPVPGGNTTADPITVIRGALGTPLVPREVKPNIDQGRGVYGGRGISINVDATNAAVAIAAFERGGLFKTVDGGAHFTHLDGLVPYWMSDVRISPSQPNIVLATVTIDSHTVNQAGIWRSTDGGATWNKPATADPTCMSRPGAFGIAFAPDSNYVYAGTDCGLAVSADLGATWTHVLPIGSPFRVMAVAAQANKVVNVLLDGGTNGFQRSLDNGTTWVTTVAPFPRSGPVSGAAPGDVHGLTVSPVSPEVLFAIGFDATSTRQPFESDDAGGSWHELTGDVFSNGRPLYIATHLSRDNDPTHIEVYFGNSGNDFRQTCTRTSGMRCDAHGWEELVNHAHEDPMEVAWGPGSNCPLYIISDGGLEGSTDFGTSNCGFDWQMVGGGSGGLGALQIYDVEGTVHDDHTDVYFATQDNLEWASPDDGATWPGHLPEEGFNIEAPHRTGTDDQTVTGLANLVS